MGPSAYFRQFEQGVAFLSDRDASVARTLINATFIATNPIAKAAVFLKRFDELEQAYRGSDLPPNACPRGLSASQPNVASRTSASNRRGITRRLADEGEEVSVARTIASLGLACLSADPIARATEILRSFDSVRQTMQRIHPHAARSIALSACRLPDPQAAALRYVKNYDLIVEEFGRVASHRAHRVAVNAFRSDRPLECGGICLSWSSARRSPELDLPNG